LPNSNLLVRVLIVFLIVIVPDVAKGKFLQLQELLPTQPQPKSNGDVFCRTPAWVAICQDRLGALD
jgi:hypothetical protein